MAIGYYIASVKISKQDVTGDDISSNVSELLGFTLKYSDIDPITFEILSKVEFPTYYQLQVKFQGYGNINTLAASINNYIRDYTVSAEFNSPQTSSILVYDTFINNPLGYYNSSNGEYTLGYTPNTTLYVTASALINSTVGSPDAQLVFAKKLSPSTYQSILSTPLTPITPSSFVNFELSGSFTPIKGERYVTYVTDSTTNDLTSSFGNFNINQLDIANVGTSGSGNDVVLYLVGDNNENPLYGNASDVVENPHYSKVDYIEYVLPQKDFEIILSGLGTKSNVSQYNYELLRSTYPRYVGSRTISPDFNLNTYPVNTVPRETYGGGLGLKPNVERTTSYFLYFNKIINTAPILKNKTTLELKYLIDENGEAYNLNTQVPTYQNLIGSFEVGKKAYASFLNNENTIYNNTQSILLSGQFYQPILSSLSSSAPLQWSNYIDFINFDGSSGSSAPSYNSTINIGGNINYNYKSPGYTENLMEMGTFSGFKTAGDYYTSSGVVVPGTNQVTSYFKFDGSPESTVTITYTAQSDNFSSTGGGFGGSSNDFSFYINFVKNGTVVKSVLHLFPYSAYRWPINASYTFTPLGTDEITITFTKVSNIASGTQTIYNGQFQIKTSGLEIVPATSSFWSLDSSNSTIITSSAQIAEAYGSFLQKPIPNSGFINFNKIFTILPEDEFRFEYQESQNNVYKVVSVEPTSSAANTPTIKVTLDHSVPNTPTTLNTSHFTIRRKSIDVGNGVTLDAPFTTNTSGGFLFPEFPTDKIKNDLPTIIASLQQKGLI
jgi:hypothetical protein